MNIIVKNISKNVVLFKFILIGAFSAFIYFFIVVFLQYFGFGVRISALVAYAFSFFAGYLGQRFFTFSNNQLRGYSLIKYGILQVFCAVFASVGSGLVFDHVSENALLVGALPLPFLALMSYFVSSLWVFKNENTT